MDDVPEGDALCEFDCRKLQCSVGEWEVCERRLQRASGELMPEKAPVAPPVAQSVDASNPEVKRPLPKG